jgi:O-antigen ligase
MRAAQLVPGAVVLGLALESGGYFPHAWVWSAVVLFWLAALVLVLRPVSLDRASVLFVGAAAALAAWTLLSATWSVAPQQSVLEARRALVYVAGALAVVVLPRRRLVPDGVLAAVVLTALVGVVRYLVSGPVDLAEGSLLSWPVGYANAFAALAAIGLPLALRRAPACVPLLVAVPVLASSRGGAVAAVAGVATFAALGGSRRTLLRVLPAAALAVGVCAVADLTGATSDLGVRRAAVAVGLVAATALAALVRPERDGRSVDGRVLAAAAAVAVVAAVAVTATGSVDSERAAYWRVARGVVADHPALGIGAGGFGRAWAERGDLAVYGGALDVHNVYLEMLAELGPVGLALLLVFLGVPLARVRAQPAVAAGYAAFLVHALLDWDWEMPAVTLAAILLGGSLLAPETGRPLGERGRLALAAAAVALAVAALLGLRSPVLPGP